MSTNSKRVSGIVQKGLNYYQQDRVKQTWVGRSKLIFQIIGKKPYKVVYHKKDRLYECSCQDKWKGIRIERNPFCSHCWAIIFWMKSGGVLNART